MCTIPVTSQGQHAGPLWTPSQKKISTNPEIRLPRYVSKAGDIIPQIFIDTIKYYILINNIKCYIICRKKQFQYSAIVNICWTLKSAELSYLLLDLSIDDKMRHHRWFFLVLFYFTKMIESSVSHQHLKIAQNYSFI